MAEITKKEVCKCTNCGNESEMIITCSLPDEPESEAAKAEGAADQKKEHKHVKGTGVCSHCGNEADMWVDI